MIRHRAVERRLQFGDPPELNIEVSAIQTRQLFDVR
jgi:hypothetical protein